MTQNDLDKLVKYVSITLSQADSIPLDIYLNDVVNFCRHNLVKEPISEDELEKLAREELNLDNITWSISLSELIEAYKAGYRKAKEE